MTADPVRIEKALEALETHERCCRLCPRQCRVDRRAGETGFCGLSAGLRVAAVLPHFGEEPPLSGTAGAGTVFFSSCNLRCVFCQNHQISHGMAGKGMSEADLARAMIRLQEKGCHNIEWVTPTPQLPAALRALRAAREAGLRLPVVYNGGGYENPEVIALLEGIVDIWLPDFKFGSDGAAFRLAGVRNYVENARASIREMVRQAGAGLEMTGETARSGVIVRHLVLPGMAGNTRQVLQWIARDLPLSVPLSLMGQYAPMPAAVELPGFGSAVSKEAYDGVIKLALEMGFEYLFVQDRDGKPLVPDFTREDPFDWEGDAGR